MAIILPHGVLFRGGAEARIRTKLLEDGMVDTVIGLPANLFYSTGIPVCVLVLKKCKRPDDVLFINAAGLESFQKGKRQNLLLEEHITKILDTYRERKEESRYSRRVGMAEIRKKEMNLNISRYVRTAEAEAEIDLAQVHAELIAVDAKIKTLPASITSFSSSLVCHCFHRSSTLRPCFFPSTANVPPVRRWRLARLAKVDGGSFRQGILPDLAMVHVPEQQGFRELREPEPPHSASRGSNRVCRKSARPRLLKKMTRSDAKEVSRCCGVDKSLQGGRVWVKYM
jgi:hypothetical protein